jgi:sterol desaturase/sphingolipid hydroxylase (fatty acid hydroxylase superfamily)
MSLDPLQSAYIDHWLINLEFDLSRYAVFAVSIWLLLWVVLRVPMASRKIGTKTPPARQLRTEFVISLRTIAIFLTIGLGMFALQRNGLMSGPALAAHWGPALTALSLLLMVVAHDAWFYWTHRTMHDRRPIALFHKRHHPARHRPGWQMSGASL